MSESGPTASPSVPHPPDREEPSRLTTGDLARLTGSTLRTIRFYEEAGLLHPVSRTGNGARRFDRSALERLRFVLELREAGLSLAEVRQLLEMRRHANGRQQAVIRLTEALDHRIAEIRERLERLKRLEETLLATRALLQGCGTCEVEEAPGCCSRCPRLREPSVPPAAHVLWCTDDP